MESLNIQLQPFFEWLLRTTLQASLLICLILLFQAVLRSRLGARWHYCLWLLLLIRMAMPWAPQSRVSVFNLIPQSVPQRQTEYARQEVEDDSADSDVADKSTAESTPISTTGIPQDSPEAITKVPEIRKEAKGRLKPVVFEIADILPLIWLIGALVLAVYVCAGNFNLLRIVKRERPLTDQKILDLLEDCKAEMGIRIILGVVATDKVKSPALFGFIRPRLLLPAGMIETLSREELRYVFLHELAHLKRHDIYIGWLMSLLQVLHWFNPLIWLAFYRLRADRELACDALVLARTQSGQAKDYGRTIVNLLERFSRSQRLPAMAGILETKAQLKRRIIMIARFKKNSYQWSPLAVILIIILSCVSLPDAKRTRASGISATKRITLRQVLADSDADNCRAVSPDGRYLSYVDYGDSGDLAIYEIANGKKHRLTNQANKGYLTPMECAFYPRWSPDSKQIAYCWWREDEFIDLRIIGLDGSKPRILYSDKEVGWIDTYDWSPDGKQILACFGRKDGPEQIVLVSAADGSVRIMKTFEKHSPGNMCFSPGGSYIVYDFPQKEDSPEHDIYLLSTDGSREISLVEHPAHDFVLGWAPDGENILFASDRTVTLSAWLIAVADGKPQGAPELVKPDIRRRLVPLGFTRDGSFYYGCGVGNRAEKFSQAFKDVYVAKLDPETGKILIPPKKAIKRFEGFNTAPSYSPDGKYLAYISTRGNLGLIPNYRSRVLCIRSLETGQERVLLPKLKNFALSCWSPDCSSIRVRGLDNKDRRGIFQIDAQTGDVTPIVLSDEDKDVGAYCQWSLDGKAIFYTLDNDTNDLCQIIFRDLETDIEKVLYHAPKKETLRLGISLSPDGNWLALINFNVFGFYNTTRRGKRVLKIMPAAGGEPRELYTFVHNWNNRPIPITWTADGKYILFLREKSNKNDPKWELCRISAEGGEPQKLGLEVTRSGFYSPSVHPDGQHIAFQSTTRAPAEVWVMENFLPTVAAAKPAHQPNFRKIWIPTKPGNGVLSPDGKKLAFVSKRRIWVVPVHGKVSPDIAGEPVSLPATKGAWRFGMRWSADGKWIAYNTLPSAAHVGICIVPSSGGKVKRIVNRYRAGHRIHNYLLSLSPDGKKVAFASDEKEKIQLSTVNVEGGDVNQLTEDGGTQPAFSPDGKKIAYVKEKPQKTEIYKGSDVWVIPAAGGIPVQVSDLKGEATGPIWSPDGKMIAFTRKAILGSDMSKEICIVPVSETGKPEASPTQIELPLETWDFLAGWTPDNNIGTLLKNPIHFAIYTVPASGGNATQVTPQGPTFNPRWSPDGKRIYFKLEDNIVSVPSDGGEISISPIDADSKFSLSWGGNAVSPDGKKIVFPASKIAFRDNKKDKEFGIYTIPVEGGEPKQLTISPGQDRFPCWSPDGKSIAFIRYSEASWNEKKHDYIRNICIVSTESGEVRQLTSESHSVQWATIAWSPDRKSIAYYSEDKTIRVIPVQGGEPRVVVKVEEVSGWSEMDWSPDEKKLAYSSTGSIWVVSLDGGEPEEIKTGLDAKASHLSWSPDGKKIAFSAACGGDQELWLMENFLPTGEVNER